MPLADYLPGLHGAHVVVLGTVTGMVLHTTFVASILQHRHLPKQMFSSLQSVQFPPYFALASASTLFLTYSTYSLSHFNKSESVLDSIFKNSNKTDSDAVAIAVMALAATASVANMLVVGPATGRVKRERELFEKAGGSVPIGIRARFGRLHAVSALLNLGVALAVVSNCFWVGNKWGSAGWR
ncbi:hypothetical protein BJ741DRAFT_612387 [Chytriomyces cf. hyalinus JEL632]|nr:hypothetical protein BJ741DRAFT_612387 [Chytriomyces cf. hyalinus JEL632]